MVSCKRFFGGSLVAIMGLVGAVMALPDAAVGAAPAGVHPTIGYAANAFGTSATLLGGTASSGKSAFVTLGCSSQPTTLQTNSVADVHVGAILSTGAVDTTSAAITVAGGTAARGVATIHDVSALAGLVTADVLTAESTTSSTSAGVMTSAAGTTVVNLKIGTTTINGTVAPNTRINLPGVGFVVVNHQFPLGSASGPSLAVDLLDIHVTSPTLGVLAGSRVIVGHAQSTLAAVAGLLDGHAYGTELTVGSTVTSGRTAFQPLACQGTDGVTKKNSVASVTIPGVVATGTVVSTAKGTVGATTASGETTSTIENVNLGVGLVTATAVKADAHAAVGPGPSFSFNDMGSAFIGLSVLGHPEISANPPPNTTVTLAGVGTLYLHRVLLTKHHIEIRMIELVVTSPNPFGLAAGADLQIGVAEASAH
jgi:hypothetical protein